MAHHGSRRRRRVRWSVLPRSAAGTLGWPMMIVMLVLATASCMAAAAAAADEEQAWYLPPPPPPLHSQKMVADETWIQSHRRLSDKGVLPTDQATPMQTTTIQSSMVFGSCAFHRDDNDNDNDDKNENDKDDDKEDDSLWGSSSGDFVFKLSAGQGHGIVCIPNLGRRMYPKTGDYREEEADEEEEHQHQQLIRPPMELQIVGVEENGGGGGGGSSGAISYTTTTTYTKKNSEEEDDDDDEQGSSNETSSTSPTNSSYIRNCFGLSDDEGSIGYPFVYTNIPPHGALVQVTCHRRRPWSSTYFVAGEPPPQSLDFVILVLDEAAQQQGILVTESFVVNEEEENNNEVTATTKKDENDETNETETTTTSSSSSSQSSHPSSWGREIVIRPTVLDAHSKIRGIQVQAYETKWPSSTQLDMAKNYPPPDEGDPEDSHHPDSATTSTTTTTAAASQLPWQAHSLVHARTNKIIHRVLDGQHDNVLAISVSVLERDEREQQQQQKEKQQQKDRDKNNNATETLPESNDENNHHKNDAATSDAQTIRRRRPNDTDPLGAAGANVEFKDLVVLLHYELETKDSKVYQRTLVVSSPTLSTTTTTTLPASSSTAPWWATPQSWFWTDWWPWKSSSPDNNGPWPVWIASTHISQEGDVQVALAGIGAVPTMTMMMMNDDENNNNNNNNDSDEERIAGKSAHQDANKEEEEEDSRFWRHRRFLCTIRVALVVAVAEESDTPVVQDDDDTTNKDDIRKKKDTPQPPSEQVTTDKQPTPTPPPTTPTTTGAKERLHSLVDVAAMVTSDSPVVVVHVGWIRKGLHALDLSTDEEEEEKPGKDHNQDEEDESWDVFVEDVLCQDPNHGYRVTHTLTVATAAATENQDGHRRRVHREDGADAGGRRRLFAHNSQGIRMLGSNHSIIMSTTTARKLLSQPPTQEELQVHDEMRMGRRPSSTTMFSDLDEKRNTKGEGDQTRRRQLQQQQRRRLGEQQTISQPLYSHRFILIHGYCSRNTWPSYHFSGDSYSVVRFNDPHKSNSHDEFAYAIRESACPYQDGKVSGNIVAHSQGGAASLHMHNFYWSCLDNNPHPGRWIQTLGTPFQGTNLAGVAASMGAIFGVGCGSVHDLTQDGAMGWLQHVQPWARKRVTYYRTQYQEHVNLFNYCHLLTHSLIGAPNDGVVQVGRGILQGGIDGGIKKTQCHVPDMRDPPQVEDHIRNAYMKSVAAIPPQKSKRRRRTTTRILGIRTSSNSTNDPLPLLSTTDEYDDDNDDDDAIIKQSSIDEENYFPQ